MDIGPDRPISLICFPPAGGLARVYDVWQGYFSEWIKLASVEYPGRGTREGVLAIPRLEALAESLASTSAAITAGPFALLGLSMGGLVAFEFAHRLTQRGRLPIHLFVCSSRSPLQLLRKKLHELPEEEFVAGLRRRQGAGVASDAGWDRTEIDFLRADVTASERYVAPAGRMLTCPVNVFSGAQDKLLPRRGLTSWCLLTDGRCSLEQFAGGHFFFREHLSNVAARIAHELAGSVETRHTRGSLARGELGKAAF